MRGQEAAGRPVGGHGRFKPVAYTDTVYDRRSGPRETGTERGMWGRGRLNLGGGKAAHGKAAHGKAAPVEDAPKKGKKRGNFGVLPGGV